MNIETVRTELEVLGNVNDMLFISIEGVQETQSTINTFNGVINTYVISTYSILEVFNLEGGSIKAIYKK